MRRGERSGEGGQNQEKEEGGGDRGRRRWGIGRLDAGRVGTALPALSSVLPIEVVHH